MCQLSRYPLFRDNIGHRPRRVSEIWRQRARSLNSALSASLTDFDDISCGFKAERRKRRAINSVGRGPSSRMRVRGEQEPKQESAPTLNRRLRDLRQIASGLKRSRMTPLQVCEAVIDGRLVNREARSFFSDLPHDERHYWIASLYALLMPDELRRRLAAYFTPPHLAHYAIGALIEAGIRPGLDRILDPASGGAAFLVPLAAHIAGARTPARPERYRGSFSRSTTRCAASRLIAGLANLSRALLKDLLNREIESSRTMLSGLIDCANIWSWSLPFRSTTW